MIPPSDTGICANSAIDVVQNLLIYGILTCRPNKVVPIAGTTLEKFFTHLTFDFKSNPYPYGR